MTGASTDHGSAGTQASVTSFSIAATIVPSYDAKAGAEGAGSPFHVRLVSTSRWASDRNSDDCISTSRDTVRGNSCASGPSV